MKSNHLLLMLMAIFVPLATYAQQTLPVYDETNMNGYVHNALYAYHGTRGQMDCPTPDNLAVVPGSLNSHGATLSWNGSSDNYIVEIANPTTAVPSATIVDLLSEGFEGGSLPQGWTKEGPGTWTVGIGDAHSNTQAHSGNYNAKISHSANGNETYLVMPVMNLTSYGSATLTCWYMNHSWAGDVDEFGVYYRTSNTGTWVELFSTDVEHRFWTKTDELVLPNEAYVQIGFKHTDNWGYGIGIDDVIINANPLEFTWTPVSNNVSATSYTLNNLVPETSYLVRVTGNCGNEGYSTPSEPLLITTLATCPVPTDLYVAANNLTAHEATLTWMADNDSYNIILGEMSYLVNADFETGDFSQANFIDGTNPWSVVDNDHSGSYCAKSASGNNNAISVMGLTVTLTNDETLTFSAKVSSESGYDKAYFYIDGVAKIKGISGNGDWIDYNYPLTAGTHTLRWLYSKDGGVAYYDDCFYVDDIKITNGTTVVDTYTTSINSYNFTGLAAETTYTAQVQGVCNGEPTAWSEVYSFTTDVACPTPTNLVVSTTGTHSVVLNWGEEGSASAWEICVNNDQTNLIVANTNENYTLTGLTPDTPYTVKVRANCGGEDGNSGWSNTLSFTTAIACPAPTTLTVGNPDFTSVVLNWTETGSAGAWEISLNGDETNLIVANTNVNYNLTGLTPDTPYTVKVRANCGGEDGNSRWSNTVSFSTPVACASPTNLAEANISFTTASLSWNGTSDSYMLQYRPWHQVGEDQVATGILTTYSFDLSDYSGTGSVAIRHYDVSDMFQLNVDNIVVTNAVGTSIYTQNFESGAMPSEITNMDLDGDGFEWGIRSQGTDNNGNPYCVGNYCASSASYLSGTALFPDNWMIISGIELGGQITFVARGQDPEWAAENFAVYVCADADFVEVPVSATTYTVTNLTPNTPYTWQVKGICGEYESHEATSLFKTKDDVLVFATEGDWNNLNNWTDAEGNLANALPTIDNNVRIDAEATIPVGLVAYANKITLGTGSIIIEDGGQLKHNSATVRVTVKKEIKAHSEEDVSEGGSGWYVISSPFSGRTLYEASGTWNHVNNLLSGNYDFYAFDPTRQLVWVNYKNPENHSHISFQSENGNAGLLYGEGYLYANAAKTTLEFIGTTGKSNNYSETEDYEYNPESTNRWEGWSLVGNFFTCNAYINYIDANGEMLEADFYVMNTEGNGWELSSSNVALPPCTGAFINYSATGKVRYSTECAEGNNNGILDMAVTRDRSMVDKARVRFGQGFNLEHKSFRNSSTKVYIPQDGVDYAVVYSEGNGGMLVNFKAEKDGIYSLSFSSKQVDFNYLHLIDNITGKDIDLLQTPSYTFEAKTTDYESRFRLVFATGETKDDSFAFCTNGIWIISNEGNATLQVIDVTGRILSSETINGSTSVNLNAAAGIYMFRLINGDNVKVQKVVVR